jgi:hypothetical protein
VEEDCRLAWSIEQYDRGLKQFCGVERAQVRSARAERSHIGLATRAFLRIRMNRLEGKVSITRDAARAYLTNPQFTFRATA